MKATSEPLGWVNIHHTVRVRGLHFDLDEIRKNRETLRPPEADVDYQRRRIIHGSAIRWSDNQSVRWDELDE